jgi:hypothetical protein
VGSGYEGPILLGTQLCNESADLMKEGFDGTALKKMGQRGPKELQATRDDQHYVEDTHQVARHSTKARDPIRHT